MYVESYPPTLQRRTVPFPTDPCLYKLPPTDQAEYLHLMSIFAYSDDRNKRNMGMSTFIKHLSMIHAFVCRGDAFDSLRGLICGIEFGLNTFLINTGRLKKLMYRSKSCMNGCFQKLGYNVCRPAHDISTLFAQIIPGYASHMLTARQWCVRRASENSQLCFIPNIKVEIASTVQSPPESPSASPSISQENQYVSVPTINPIPINIPMAPSFAPVNHTVSALVPPRHTPKLENTNTNKFEQLSNCAPVSSPLSVADEEAPVVVKKEVKPQFMFDISTLLNHQAPSQDIHRMFFAPLSPVRC
ncbi:hypothetical protein TRFO_22073 [Tritrichomonas foetus]|uniref:Initiator binding domain-containing protein n=1 Tax=Tritrichomonas foetus TaxID=1144522 RepID=A0A1J4KCL0_9EUKA|nr:hypothetical protein TRFO_22073 [Tritrichomonas foetus]|eukprot:OHT09153.1 hypothetical protein TRFO_22073 [Tritrichomonas foetus]